MSNQNQVKEYTLPDGLKLAVLPMPGFKKMFGGLTTAYGGMDLALPDGTEIPQGIAHFLEHKMFAMPEGDVFSMFSKRGASSNAFTSAEQTTYYFTCTDEWQTHLETLLTFVQTPYFEPKNVEKECGIIDQEIRMIQDNPEWRAYMRMLQTRFQKHPMRIPIAGTVETIKAIDAPTLHQCHQAFYAAEQLLLVVAGALDADEVYRTVKSIQNKVPHYDHSNARALAASSRNERIPSEYRARVGRELSGRTENGDAAPAPVRTDRYEMRVSMPKVRISFLDDAPAEDPQQAFRNQLITQLALDWRFGMSSPSMQPLYQQGLITDQFGVWSMQVFGAGIIVFGGDSPDPQKLYQELYRISNAPFSDHDRQAFERLRRKNIATWVRMQQSPDQLAQTYTRFRLKGQNMFEMANIMQEIRVEEVEQRFLTMFDWHDAVFTTVESAPQQTEASS